MSGSQQQQQRRRRTDGDEEEEENETQDTRQQEPERRQPRQPPPIGENDYMEILRSIGMRTGGLNADRYLFIVECPQHIIHHTLKI